jgi:hypothetical protein
MKNSRGLYLTIITAVLAIYYLFLGIYLNRLGYANPESLFYIEKAKIVFQGVGDRIKVMGLTTPIFPFYATFIFTLISYTLAPIIASAIGTAVLFNILATNLVKRFNDDFYLFILLLLFLFHPGILYSACSGKGMYLVLIFFFLFFLNVLKFYKSNTTFHISIASICLVVLVFCDYKFIWLTLFFIPLVLSIAIQSLNLSEKESIFRLFISFNSPTLRRKLINKTFALYIIIFILPIASIVAFKLLNLTHANDLNYFIESPYATWNVLADKINFDQVPVKGVTYFLPEEISLLITARVLIFCPLILLGVYMFKDSTYQILTILTPFAFVEFLHIKYEKTFLVYDYYMIFLILALLCIIYKGVMIKNQLLLKIGVGVILIIQIFTGYIYLRQSRIVDEQNFITILLNHQPDPQQSGNRDAADYINSLPGTSKVLVDDAVAYPVAAYVNNIQHLTMPYEDEFASAIEIPNKFDDYILIATAKNAATGYTQVNDKYAIIVKQDNSRLNLQKIFENHDWILYRIIMR